VPHALSGRRAHDRWLTYKSGTIAAVETWDALRARRNVRQYEDRPVSSEDLDRILEAGRRAPSAGNQQRWDFVVCTDREQLEELSKVWRGARHVASAAAAIAVLAPDSDDPNTTASIQFDLGQTMMAMMVAAADLGIGSGHAAARDQELAREILGHPEDRRCALMIGLGYPADRPLTPLKDPDRRPFEDVVHRGRW
jgi:nitroreductase